MRRHDATGRTGKAQGRHAVAALLPLLAAALLATACRQVPVVEPDGPHDNPLRENMINANRLIAQSEESQIEAYVSRRGWRMERLTGGVRVMATGGSGQAPLDYEDTVALRYSVETLGGETLYSQRCDTVTVGRMQPTRGIDAALRTLHDGASATVILPSEQAFGVVGDGDRISTRLILVYKLNVNKIKKK